MTAKPTTARIELDASPARPTDGIERARLERLLDAVIEEAPALVQRKMLLAAADWRLASGEQVERLQRRLAGAGRKLPPWLARDLLIAGHTLGDENGPALTPELRLLAALNALKAGEALPAALRAAIGDTAAVGSTEAAVVTAITRRLREMGESSLAVTFALGHWPQVTDALGLVRKALQDEIAQLPPLKIHVAGFSTTHFLAEALRPAFARVGRQALVDQAGYGSAMASLHDPEAEADAMILLLDREGGFAHDWRNGLARESENLERRLAALCEAIQSWAERSGRPLFINTLPAATSPLVGHMDAFHDVGACAFAMKVNQRLAALAAAHPAVHLVDTDLALAHVPPERRFDPKLWYYGRFAYPDEAAGRLASAFAQAWTARQRGPVKVLALDFDNTLWGGVYGDDGVAGLLCGDEFPGSAYKALQQECLRLKAQGLLLVALSKNNPDAIGVFAIHGGMALSADDFVATAIDWQAKPDNLRRVAGELNLGLDSFLFLDDSPHEREAMRRMCPEVLVPEMPAHPELRPLWLRTLACTWPVRLTDEDAQRSEMYVAQKRASALREASGSYEAYLRDLDQCLSVEPLSESTLARVAQLHARTNQFNLTTRRFSEAELATFMADAQSYETIVGTAADRFGHHGIVICAVASVTDKTATIESFLMSCRVIARQIETACLGALLERLVERGVETVEGSFIPTAKNALVCDVYPSHGFRPLSGDGTAERWIWQRGRDALPNADNVRVQWRTS